MHFKITTEKLYIIYQMGAYEAWREMRQSKAGNMFTTFETLNLAAVFAINLLEFSQLLNHTLIYPILPAKWCSLSLSRPSEGGTQTLIRTMLDVYPMQFLLKHNFQLCHSTA